MVRYRIRLRMRCCVAVATLVVVVAGCTTPIRRSPPPSPSTQTTPGTPDTIPTPLASSVDYGSFCGGSPACPTGGVPASLRRPLTLPQLSPGQPCPVSSPTRIEGPFGPVLGAGGPALLVIGESEGSGTAVFEYPPPSDSLFARSGYGGTNALWLTPVDSRSPVLVRGRQLDGTNPVGFGSGRPLAELQLPPTAGASLDTVGKWRAQETYLRLRAPGCYGLQVDAADRSTAIVFTARQT
jgi:hypothetical protein